MQLSMDRNLSWIPLSFSSQGHKDKELHTSHRTWECVQLPRCIPTPSHDKTQACIFSSSPTPFSFLEGQMCRCRQEGLIASKEEGVVEDKGKLLQFWWKQGRGRIGRYEIPDLLRNVGQEEKKKECLIFSAQWWYMYADTSLGIVGEL